MLRCKVSNLRHAIQFRRTVQQVSLSCTWLRPVPETSGRYVRVWKVRVEPYTQKSAIRFRGIALLDGVGTAAGADRPAFALLELEGQYVEQAINAIRERLEHRLFFQRRDVEMKA